MHIKIVNIYFKIACILKSIMPAFVVLSIIVNHSPNTVIKIKTRTIIVNIILPVSDP